MSDSIIDFSAGRPQICTSYIVISQANRFRIYRTDPVITVSVLRIICFLFGSEDTNCYNIWLLAMTFVASVEPARQQRSEMQCLVTMCFFRVDPVDQSMAQLLLQFPEGKSVHSVDWIGVLSRRNKVLWWQYLVYYLKESWENYSVFIFQTSMNWFACSLRFWSSAFQPFLIFLLYFSIHK